MLLANKGTSSQTMIFPVVMYGCESWTIKEAECQLEVYNHNIVV